MSGHVAIIFYTPPMLEAPERGVKEEKYVAGDLLRGVLREMGIETFEAAATTSHEALQRILDGVLHDTIEISGPKDANPLRLWNRHVKSLLQKEGGTIHIFIDFVRGLRSVGVLAHTMERTFGYLARIDGVCNRTKVHLVYALREGPIWKLMLVPNEYPSKIQDKFFSLDPTLEDFLKALEKRYKRSPQAQIVHVARNLFHTLVLGDLSWENLKKLREEFRQLKERRAPMQSSDPVIGALRDILDVFLKRPSVKDVRFRILHFYISEGHMARAYLAMSDILEERLQGVLDESGANIVCLEKSLEIAPEGRVSSEKRLHMIFGKLQAKLSAKGGKETVARILEKCGARADKISALISLLELRAQISEFRNRFAHPSRSNASQDALRSARKAAKKLANKLQGVIA